MALRSAHSRVDSRGPPELVEPQRPVRALLGLLVLSLACVAAVSVRLFSVVRFENIVHEFDPWFNFRATQYLSLHGLQSFRDWFDDMAWYPLGRHVGETVYPGLMLTATSLQSVLSWLGVPISLSNICIFLPPAFAALTALVSGLLTHELWGPTAGLTATCLVALAPGHISRSTAGSYDNEAVALCGLQLTSYLWVRSVKTGSMYWATLCSFSYVYLVSAWGGYVFIINLIPLHVFVLLVCQRFSSRVYIAYNTFYILSLILSMQVPFVGFKAVCSSEHMASAGIFVLLQVATCLHHVRRQLLGWEPRFVSLAVLGVLGMAMFVLMLIFVQAGVIAPWSERLRALWAPSWRSAVVASVSEHQPSNIVTFFLDLHIMLAIAPVGLWFCCNQVDDARFFMVTYGVTAAWLAHAMVRLMVTLAPPMCILAAISLSRFLDEVFSDEQHLTEDIADSSVGEECATNGTNGTNGSSTLNVLQQDWKSIREELHCRRQDDVLESSGPTARIIMLTAFIMIIAIFVSHCTYMANKAYSSPGVIVERIQQDGTRVVMDDFREAFQWLRHNTAEDARVMAWWDYGYQIAGMSGRTTVVDNNTWNNTHIALVAKTLMSTEAVAHGLLQSIGVDLVLVVFGGLGYRGDDIAKAPWMVRIAASVFPDIKEKNYFTPGQGVVPDEEALPAFKNSLLYQLSYHRFAELQPDRSRPPSFDQARQFEMGKSVGRLCWLEEAFTSENWIVRIYRVNSAGNRGEVRCDRGTSNVL
uniref:dolichyl-diphosphooligosaccharide--protein glycotransferase n=2 Tax=Eptatretus burgeri TaxID=7764 RepID=A0A8C4QVU9_EPTBU